MNEPITTSTRQVFQGHAAGPGRVIGAAFHWRAASVGLVVPADDSAPEDRLRRAFAAADDAIAARITLADTTLAPLLDAQRLMLDDPELRDGALSLVRGGADPAEAVVTVSGQLAAVLEAADSAYFRDRAIDVRAVGKLLAEILAGRAARPIPAGAVVLAEELAPLDAAELSEAGVAALAVVCGGPTCHAAIIARAWGIPAVVGAPPAVLQIPEGTPVCLDGDRGLIITDPDAGDLLDSEASVAPVIFLPHRVPLYANVGTLAEVERALAHGAEGIGLLRTEFLFQGRTTAPGEEEQADEYREILRRMDGRPVVIRTLDIGADKPVPFLPLPAEPNPQLGLRGIRLCLREQTLFVTQLRALARASAAGPLKIMLPMVTTADEVRQARALLDTAAEGLGIAAPPLGAMIEVPMAALAAAELAEVSDFFSLGTNDLMQFLLAADRQHAGVGYLHAADYPAVWGLLGHVITAAHAAGIPVGICGEWGADNKKLRQLLELGIDSVSVAVGSLPRVQALFPPA